MIHFFSLIIPILAGSISIILGLLLLVKKGKSRFQKTILFSTPWVMILQIGTFLITANKAQEIKVLGGQMALLSLCFLTPTCTKLAVLWGKSNGDAIPRKTKLLHIGQWLISMIFIGFIPWGKFLFITQDTTSEVIIAFGPSGKYFLIYLIISSVLILSIFENKLKVFKNTNEIRIPTIIFMGIFIFFIILASQGLLIHTFNSGLLLLISVLIFTGYLVPISIRFKNFMIFDRILDNRETVYSSFMILLVGAYLIVIGIIGKLIVALGGNIQVFFSVIAATVVIIIFFMIITSFSLKVRIRKFINKSFFKGKFDYRMIWSKFSEETSFILNLDELINSILDTITDILQVDRGAILLIRNNSTKFKLVKKKIYLK